MALVVGADGKVQQRVLAVERAIGDRWLVTDGLGEGDQVIVEGLLKIRPGMPVKAVAAAAKPAAGGNPPAASTRAVAAT